ncbi:hypothetical protein GC174_18125 [bacterium]|nr:hypothetical protein [bacterium]
MKPQPKNQKNKTGYPRASLTKDTGVRESDSPAAPAGVFADNNDASRYALLIEKYPLLPIKSEDSYDCALQILEAIGDKINSSNATPSELGYFEVLSSLIENFEEKHYPSARSMQPNEFLRYLMDMNDLKQEDLIEEFGSQSRVSEFLNNKRDLTLKQIKNLSERFRVTPSAFMP